MKKLFVLLFAIIFSLPLFCQARMEKWMFSVDFGLQAHDKRLFDFASRWDREELLKKHPGFFGTYQFGISASRKILHKERFELFTGVGLSSELSTFTRPFDHRKYKSGFAFDILLLTNRYYQNLMQLPITPRFRVGDRFAVSIEVLPQFNFLTVAKNTKNPTDLGKITWWRFDFYSVEVNPGLSFDLGRFEFGMKYRAFQVKKIDKILFNRIINDPRTDQVFETYNPFKLWFSVGYKF